MAAECSDGDSVVYRFEDRYRSCGSGLARRIPPTEVQMNPRPPDCMVSNCGLLLDTQEA
jgi:hypothetical protein